MNNNTTVSIGYTQHVHSKITTKISNSQQAILTGYKTSFDNPIDIISGNQYQSNSILYNATVGAIKNTISLLHKASNDLEEMHNTVQQMQDLYYSVAFQNFSSEQLGNFDAMFQNHINTLDQIATNSSYFSLSLLNGDMDSANPRVIYAPNNDRIEINLEDMRNSASPIAKPGSNDPQIEISCTVAEFSTEINIPAGAPVNVLANIQGFCGKDSFLYILANEINNAFNVGVANVGNERATCIDYLQNINWYNLLPAAEGKAAIDLIDNEDFIEDSQVSTIGTYIDWAQLISQDDALYLLMRDIITLNYIPAEYVTKASTMLSIASPDYFNVVEVRLKHTIDYIVNAQANINMQIRSLEGRSNLYNMYAEQNLDRANAIFKTNPIEESSKLARLMQTHSIALSYTGFTACVENIIFNSAREIINKFKGIALN